MSSALSSVGIPPPSVLLPPTFPIPQAISFATLGLPSEAEQLFIEAGRQYMSHEGVSASRYRDGIVTSPLAFRVGRRMRFGQSAVSPLWQQTWGVIDDRFFNGASFFRRDYELRPVEVKLDASNPFTDGDTARVVAFRSGGEWVGRRVNVRMDGIDTPESNPSEKLNRHVKYIARYLNDEHGIEAGDMEALQGLVKARLVYLGKLAGAATFGFGSHFAEIGLRLGPAYARAPKVPELCDSLDMWDKYDRVIGRILAGAENQGEDLIAGFIEAALPAFMQEAKAEYFTAYRKAARVFRRTLDKWLVGKPALYQVVCPESAPNPSVLFSEGRCGELASLWKSFLSSHSDAANDLQTMMVFLGLAPPYLKYRGHRTPLDLAAEAYALGRVPGLPVRHGLTSDTMYIFVRPNVDPTDPDHSRVYLRYGTLMSDIKELVELNPPDCLKDGFCSRSPESTVSS